MVATLLLGRVLLVFDDLRGKHFRASLAAVILEELEFILFAAVADDSFVLAIGATVYCLINYRLGRLVATPEQAEVRADFLKLFFFCHR